MLASKAHSTQSCWLDAWHVNPSANRDYDFIDGLRGVAILMVLLCHHFYTNPEAGRLVHFVGGLFAAGGKGVTLFFALSGFLISWPFWKRKFNGANHVVPVGYAKRRFWKIYPPLALSVILLTPAYIAINHTTIYITAALQWLSGLSFIVPVNGELNPVMWSLVIEVQFYMTLPLIFLALRKVPAQICLWLIPALFLIVPLAFRLLTGAHSTFHPYIDSHYPSALDSFCFGIFIAGLDNRGAIAKRWAMLGLVGIALWALSIGLYGWVSIAQLPAGKATMVLDSMEWMQKIGSGFLLLYIADPQHPIARLLCYRPLRWCGIISYEWYLFHQPITLWARQYFGPAGGNVLLFVAIVGGSFLVSAILSALVYRYYSLPILKYGRA